MNRSESIINLAKALLKFQSSIGTIKKDAKNPHFKSNFASLSGILDAVTPVLSEVGLVVLQHPSGDGLVINLETILIHAETGEYMSSEFSMRPAKTDPQGIGSCITYMRRYALGAILELNIDDDDGNAASQVKQPVKQYSKAEPKSEPLPENSQVIGYTFDTVLNCVKNAQTIEELDSAMSGRSQLFQEYKTAANKEILFKAYKERMEYIKGGEGM